MQLNLPCTIGTGRGRDEECYSSFLCQMWPHLHASTVSCGAASGSGCLATGGAAPLGTRLCQKPPELPGALGLALGERKGCLFSAAGWSLAPSASPRGVQQLCGTGSSGGDAPEDTSTGMMEHPGIPLAPCTLSCRRTRRPASASWSACT